MREHSLQRLMGNFFGPRITSISSRLYFCTAMFRLLLLLLLVLPLGGQGTERFEWEGVIYENRLSDFDAGVGDEISTSPNRIARDARRSFRIVLEFSRISPESRYKSECIPFWIPGLFRIDTPVRKRNSLISLVSFRGTYNRSILFSRVLI
jgi:hypothetical protein